MPPLRLVSWNSKRFDVLFDPGSGEATWVRLARPRPDSGPVTGVAVAERTLGGARCNFAVYVEASGLVFNAGAKRWPLSDATIRFVHQAGWFCSTFRVYRGECLEFTFTYWHLWRGLFSVIDATYDGLDREYDFFLHYFALCAGSPEWQQWARERWSLSTAA